MGITSLLFGKRINSAINSGVKQSIDNILNDDRKARPSKSAYYGGGSGSYFGSLSGGSGGAKWDYGLSADGRTRYLDHYRMRQNARDMFHDSLDARGIIERMSDTIVDTGLILESAPDSTLLGITAEASEDWAANVERRFHLWASDKKQHRAGLMTFYQAQRLYEIQQQRDNDVFARFYYSGEKTLQNPLQFSFIDANQIRATGFTSTYAQFGHDDGIGRNADGTEKDYKIWIRNDAKPGEYSLKTVPRVGSKSGKIMMIHGFNPEYAGQQRGYARLGFAIQEMENLTDFTSAAIKKAINQSNLVLSVENQQKDPGQDFSGLIDPTQSALGPSSITPTAQEEIDRLANVNYCPIPEATVGAPGSVAVVGNDQGDMIKMLGNSAPADDFKSFIGVFTERLASAAGIPQEVVLMKFGQNYSASRATLLLFWSVVEMWRAEMAADFLNPIYESWLSEEIAAGRVTAPGWSDPRLRAAWLSCSWVGSPLPSIDPKKESEARRANLELNLTTLERESRDLNGSDAKTNIERNKKTFPEMVAPYWVQNSEPETGDETTIEDED